MAYDIKCAIAAELQEKVDCIENIQISEDCVDFTVDGKSYFASLNRANQLRSGSIRSARY